MCPRSKVGKRDSHGKKILSLLLSRALTCLSLSLDFFAFRELEGLTMNAVLGIVRAQRYPQVGDSTLLGSLKSHPKYYGRKRAVSMQLNSAFKRSKGGKCPTDGP